MKWKDKRDLFIISSKHEDSVEEVTKRGETITKPKVVIDYNKGKSFKDRSDQMSSDTNPLRRSLKWHRKIGIDLLLSVSIVNALSIYQSVTGKTLKVRLQRKCNEIFL